MSDDLACRVDRHALPSLLETVRQEGNEIMIFVGNRGCVQIFTGALEKLAPMRGWLNISILLLPCICAEESVDEVWGDPQADFGRTRHQRRMFAKDGTQIAQLYGQRSEGHPEQTQWRQQVDRLTREGQPA
ncbi:hemin transport protein HmuS [Klebsiella pneumoniae]|uniref:Hemin transport protein HmuS n=1 Tax=Klebsiella pneumoniae TaxID=573 RepID=A0A2X1QEJ2_KLEPN|nr:hemin transport protein HmuS [Klebsiella pneumoniae]